MIIIIKNTHNSILDLKYIFFPHELDMHGTKHNFDHFFPLGPSYTFIQIEALQQKMTKECFNMDCCIFFFSLLK